MVATIFVRFNMVAVFGGANIALLGFILMANGDIFCYMALLEEHNIIPLFNVC